MKRKALAVLLAATMVMGLAGCGSSKDAAATTDTAATEDTADAADDAATTDAAGNSIEGMTVAFIPKVTGMHSSSPLMTVLRNMQNSGESTLSTWEMLLQVQLSRLRLSTRLLTLV